MLLVRRTLSVNFDANHQFDLESAAGQPRVLFFLYYTVRMP